MKAKFSGECKSCEERWEAGEEVGFVNDEVVCGECCAVAARIEQAEAVKEAHAAVDAMRGLPKYRDRLRGETEESHREFVVYRLKVLTEMRAEARRRGMDAYADYLDGGSGSQRVRRARC